MAADPAAGAGRLAALSIGQLTTDNAEFTRLAVSPPQPADLQQDRGPDCLLGIVRQRPPVSRKLGCVDREDRGCVGGQQAAAGSQGRPAGGQCQGQQIALDPAGALFSQIGSGNLRQVTPAQGTGGVLGTSN
jgi:hypothetical protein